MVRFKVKNKNGEISSIDYLLSDNNKENLSLLKLRGILNAIGSFNAARTLNELVGTGSDVKVTSSTLIKQSTLMEGTTIIGSEEAAKGNSK